MKCCSNAKVGEIIFAWGHGWSLRPSFRELFKLVNTAYKQAIEDTIKYISNNLRQFDLQILFCLMKSFSPREYSEILPHANRLRK